MSSLLSNYLLLAQLEEISRQRKRRRKNKYSLEYIGEVDENMKRGKIFLGIGIVLIIGGLTLAVLGGRGVVGSIEEPRDVAVEELEFENIEEEEKIVTLDEGSYEIWLMGEDREINLQVYDEDGEDIFEDSRIDHSISIGGRSYEKIGDLEISEEGDYTFVTEEECTLYVTEPISGVFGICGGISFIIIGGLLLLVGIVLVVLGIMKKGKSKTQEDYSSKKEGSPPPPPPED